MKKILVLLMVVAFSLTFVACTEEKPEEKQTDANKVTEAIEKLSIDDRVVFDSSKENPSVSQMELPSSGEHGVNITWASSDSNVIENTGKVWHYASDKSVDLKAAFKLGDASGEKTYTVIVEQIGNSDTIVDVKAKSDGDAVNILGTVYSITNDGFYINDGESNIFVNSDKSVVTGGSVYVLGTKETIGSKIYVEANANTNFYSGTSSDITTDGVSKSIFNIIALSNPNKDSNYGREFFLDGFLNEYDGDLFLDSLNGDTKIKIAEEFKGKLSTVVGKKVELFGMLHEYDSDASVWECVLINDAYKELDMSDRDVANQIVVWIRNKFPDDGNVSGIAQLELPETHPNFPGSKITWVTDGKIVSESGLVTAPVRDTSFELIFTVKYNDETILGNGIDAPAISLTIESSIPSVSEVMNEKIYSEAKPSWAPSGNYSYDGIRHVSGIVVSCANISNSDRKEKSITILKDESADAYIELRGVVACDDKYSIGDFIVYSNLKLETKNYKPILVPAKDDIGFTISEVADVVVGDPLELTYEAITQVDFKALDEKNLENYNKLFKIEDLYLCKEEGNASSSQLRSRIGVASIKSSCMEDGVINDDGIILEVPHTYAVDEEKNTVEHISNIFINANGYFNGKVTMAVENSPTNITHSFVHIGELEVSDKTEEEKENIVETYYRSKYDSGTIRSIIFYKAIEGIEPAYLSSNFANIYHDVVEVDLVPIGDYTTVLPDGSTTEQLGANRPSATTSDYIYGGTLMGKKVEFMTDRLKCVMSTDEDCSDLSDYGGGLDLKVQVSIKINYYSDIEGNNLLSSQMIDFGEKVMPASNGGAQTGSLDDDMQWKQQNYSGVMKALNNWI